MSSLPGSRITRAWTRPTDPVHIPFFLNGEPRPLRLWLSRTVGSGTFGVINRAEMTSPTDPTSRELVAVKRFNPIAMDGNNEFITREIDRWYEVDHPHILPFYGECDLGVGQCGLVSPFCQNGNMKEFISKYPRADRLTLVKQVADALHYLHFHAGIVHGDLKCENVLIANDNRALLADFGLSTLVERTETPTATFIRRCYTACFAAPELLSDLAFNEENATNQKPRSKTQHSDSFAFGRFMYEAYMGEAAWRRASVDQVLEHVLAGDIPPRIVTSPLCLPMSDGLWRLCLACWKTDQFARPSAAAIRDVLRTLHA